MRPARLLLLSAGLFAGLLAGQSACLFAGQTAAAQMRDSVYTIGEITVTTNREGVAPERASQRVTVLDVEDVRSTASTNVADLLEARGGLFVRRNGTGLATASLRGSGPSQTLLLIDGMRLSSPQLGQFDLSLLPSYLFSSIEVAHGPVSSLYGADGMAGVINMRRRAPNADRLHLLTEVGAYGRRLISGGASFSGSVSGTIALEAGRTEGNYPFLNEALFPARVVRRRNADRAHHSFFTAATTTFGPHRLNGAMLYASTAQGLPGLAGSPAKGERQWDEHVRLWVQDDVNLAGGRLIVRGFVHHASIRYLNPQISVDDTGRTLTSSLEVEARRPIGPHWLVIAGASGGFAAAEHPSLASSAEEVHGSAYASASWIRGPLRLYPALRTDVYVRPRAERSAAVSPRLGLNIQPIPTVPLYVKANAGTAFRMPTFNDRFWRPGGNPDLLPEHSQSIEAGFYLDGLRMKAEITGFASKTIQKIQWVNEAGDIWTPINLARSISRGLEGSVRVSPVPSVTAGALYLYTFATDRSDSASPEYGRQLRYVPRHQAKIFAGARLGEIRLDVNGRYLGLRYVTSDETEWLPSSIVVDAQAGVSRSIGPFRAQLSLIFENLTDARYAVIQDYPMPPRHLRIRLLLETAP